MLGRIAYGTARAGGRAVYRHSASADEGGVLLALGIGVVIAVAPLVMILNGSFWWQVLGYVLYAAYLLGTGYLVGCWDTARRAAREAHTSLRDVE